MLHTITGKAETANTKKHDTKHRAATMLNDKRSLIIHSAHNAAETLEISNTEQAQNKGDECLITASSK